MEDEQQREIYWECVEEERLDEEEERPDEEDGKYNLPSEMQEF
jgi:hypothetical protein